MRRRKRRKQRKIIIISSLTLLFIMTVGYAAFQTNINITAKGNILEKGITINELKTKVTTSGDGLYVDTYETNRYIYRGANPDNYISFNNELWRIIAIELDGTLKIMKKDSIGNIPWDTDNSNDWTKPATLNTRLNDKADTNSYYNKLDNEAKNLIQEHIWGIGPVIWKNTDLSAQIKSENTTTWTGNIGLISASDAIKANTNTTNCGNAKLHYDNKELCRTTNYIITTPSGHSWLISSSADRNDYAVYMYPEGVVTHYYANSTFSGVLPTVYLIPDVTLKGDGTETNPYTIITK